MERTDEQWAEYAHQVFSNSPDPDLCADEAREIFRQSGIPERIAELVVEDIFG